MDDIISTDRNYRRQKVPANVGTGSTWAGFLVFVQLFFFTLSMANAWQFFYTRRTYQMRMKEEDTSLLTSNCRRVAVGTRRPQWAKTMWGWGPWMLWKWIARVDDRVQGEIWELSMWTPSIFSRNLFCWYSPVQLLILAFMNGSNWFYILPLAAAVAGQCTFLVVSYTTMVKDKQILFSEVYNEYNQKFVHPRVFAPRRDVSTSTMEDWAMARRYGEYLTGMPMGRSQRVSGNRRSAMSASADEYDSFGYNPEVTPYERPPHRRSIKSARSTRSTRDSGTSTIPEPYTGQGVSSVSRRHRGTAGSSNESIGYPHSDDSYSIQRHQHQQEQQQLNRNITPGGTFRIRDRTERRRQQLKQAQSSKTLYH
ncbi:hypothetical protein GGF37_002924 [Kickxella alabastrina]|nr:hypothetical protein GGF37_002924 [Kickxella alabastrina]